MMREKFPNINFGLYRDDGLGTIRNTPKTTLTRLTKDIFKLFKTEFGLSITMDTNLTIVNFLDVTFNLSTNRYYPYRKPNDQPIYIHKESNHPPHVTKQLPNSVNKRLNDISCDKVAFETSKREYEKALSNSCLKPKLSYEEKSNQNENHNIHKNRRRNVIWFTPPYNAALKTNLGKEFLKLIDKNFPINHHLHKIINRKTVKISYSCTPNMKSIIQTHNKNILTDRQPDTTTRCNCQKKASCPTPGECCQEKVVYKATVHHPNGSTADYIGSTETTFKKRFSNHKKSFNHQKYRFETTLSKYIWDEKLNNHPNVSWSFLKKCSTYEIGGKTCDLCLSEKKFIIASMNKNNLINKRTDIGNKCPHKKKQDFRQLLLQDNFE